MGRLRITPLLPLALALLLLANLPTTASAPQRQPQSQVEAEAQPGLDVSFKVMYVHCPWNFTDLSVNIRDIIVLPVSKFTAEKISDEY